MADQEPKTNQPVSMSADDLDAALRLLAAEEQAVQVSLRTIIANIVSFVALGTTIVACPLGLLTVWFSSVWGWSLLAAALIGAIAFSVAHGLVGKSGLFHRRAERLRGAIENSDLASAAKAAWEKRAFRTNITLGVFFLVCLLLFLVGLIWLIYTLVRWHDVSPPAIVLILLPLPALFALVALSGYREFQYFSHVSRLQSRLQSASAGANDTIQFSSQEVDLLAQVETQQVVRGVAKATRELPERLKEYSVMIAPEALAYLRSLPERDRAAGYAIRELADSLQINPRPPFAHPVSQHTDDMVINHQNFAMTYRVDDARLRVSVISIHDLDRGEVDNAA